MMRALLLAAALTVMPALARGAQMPAAAAGAPATEALSPPRQSWGFSGILGRIDKKAARRGFTTFDETCGACHALAYLHYRDLAGIGFSAAEIKAIAGKAMVPAGVDARGRPVTRQATPADPYRAPFPSEDAARAAFNGALPPDLSLAMNSFPNGPDYVHALLNGYQDAPAGFPLRDGMNYNVYYPGRQIAMPPPLADHVPQTAHDVVTFLQWAANPETNTRKNIGVRAVLYFLAMTAIAYGFQRRVWSKD